MYTPFIGEKRSYPVLTVNPWADYIIFYYIFNKCWKKVEKRRLYRYIYIDDYFLYWFFRYKILFESVLLLTFLLSLLLSGQLADSRTLPSTPHLRDPDFFVQPFCYILQWIIPAGLFITALKIWSLESDSDHIIIRTLMCLQKFNVSHRARYNYGAYINYNSISKIILL